MSEFWIQTFAGKKFDLLEPTGDMICIEDIAHHLSILTRWVGATKFPYSVAEHSLMVAKYCSEELKLEGLLHDAAEAYTNDFSYPFKKLMRHLEQVEIDAVVNQIQELIEYKFKLGFGHHDLIKVLDLRAAKTERNQLLLAPVEQYDTSYENAEPFKENILNLQWWNVEQLFLEMYEKYRRDR